MIDIKTARAIKEAWSVASENSSGVDAARLREELLKREIGYYKLREYLSYYCPGNEAKDIDKTLDIIYYPQAKNLRANENIPIKL